MTSTGPNKVELELPELRGRTLLNSLHEQVQIRKTGEIVNENTYRLQMARKEHKKHVRELLAQAIVHRTLDMERSRQVAIKQKLEEIAKIELVRRVRVSASFKESKQI